MTDRQTTATAIESCPYCGFQPHDYITQCPSVKAIEYYEDGRIRRIEKFSVAPWPYATLGDFLARPKK